MMRRLGVAMTAGVLVASVCTAMAQTAGTITAVRVYQGQALVTREVGFEAKGGAQEVVVTGLPEALVPTSLYGTGSDAVTIRAVRFRATASQDAPRPEVRALDDEIKAKGREAKRLESQLGVLEARSKLLDTMEAFSATKVTDEVDKGSLNPKMLQDTAKFLFEKRDEIAAEQVELEAKAEDLAAEIELLRRQRAELTGTGQKTTREAVVFVDTTTPGPARLELSYLVGGVGWTPAYSARLATGHDRLALEYHALVTQMSGEDWSQVALTLSTSTPGMQAEAPLLTPMRIGLVPAGMAQTGPSDDAYAERRLELQQQIRGQQGNKGDMGPAAGMGMGGMMGPGMMPGGGMMGGPGVPAPPAFGDASGDEVQLAANYMAAQLQNLELSTPDEAVRLSAGAGAGAVEGLAVDYEIPGKVSIESRLDQQMFHIATLDLAADFHYTSVPLLSDYVYQMVDGANTSEYALLAGPYNAYTGAAFSGRGQLPLVAIGQNLALGFGIESQLRASRELVSKTTTVRGGNKMVQYSYRLRLHNYTDRAVKVVLWDRLPQPPDSQVTVALGKTDQPLSTDALYVSQQKPRGLLRWDVEVPAKASSADAFVLNYEFSAEFDRNFEIGDLPASATEAMRKDLGTMRKLQFGSGAAM